jgi:hypothetical protein
MSDVVPSYILKLDRAQEHLDVLKREIQTFVESHPYTVTKRREGKKDVWRLNFTPQLPPHVALVGADFVHNVRSALDHLAAALVPAARRDSTYFPILWERVWDPPVEEENKQAADDRAKWTTIVTKMKPGAVEVLKRLQPYAGYTPVSEYTHLLDSLNRLWNTDKHSRLPFMTEGLGNSTMIWTMADGTTQSVTDNLSGGLGDNAKLIDLRDVVDVKIKGTVVVAIRVAHPDGFIPLPYHFEGILDYARAIVGWLVPYLHVAPKQARA